MPVRLGREYRLWFQFDREDKIAIVSVHTCMITSFSGVRSLNFEIFFSFRRMEKAEDSFLIFLGMEA
jgi:hypothetical protein